ncbi:hypothetical protein QAD02_013409 [Eretmocerus hayati]|uniref:Uncharacterized protein n=1 Tax=Eretmocerus hayati TaxID=131215 RepID=A0ACC2P5B2_9HYME|nr:hypothetical protein QAD02_013409 [Eretmocerus hayati]
MSTKETFATNHDTNNEAIARSNDVDGVDGSGDESRELDRDAIENGSVDIQSDNEHGVIPPPFDELGDSSNDSPDQNKQTVSDSSETDSANTDSVGSPRDGLRETEHEELPKDARTLLQTPSTSTPVKAIGSGS